VTISYWHESAGPLPRRAALPGDTDVDVAIVGGGFTGLWTAYYLAHADPGLRIAVLEREVVGFGASGRNGGWCVGEFAAKPNVVDRVAGREAAVAMARAVHATVDEVARVIGREQIDCHFAKGGSIDFATTKPQLDRIEARVASLRDLGFGEEDYALLGAADTLRIINAANVKGGLYSPHCAALQPARLARGVAEAAERAGAKIYEHTAVTALRQGGVETARGRVRAAVVVRATEAYTNGLPGHERELLPIGNYMIVTDPIPRDMWDEIGLRNRETFADGRHVIFYGQRTIDDRFAFGGLSIPYRYGSGTELGGNPTVRDRLRAMLLELFPSLGDVTVSHHWGGVLGAPRDSFPSVGYDQDTGYAWGGGYVGEGVAAANLAGRTLADLITKEDSDLVHLPWVGHRSPDWEDEPWRWLEFTGLRATLAVADRAEKATGRQQRWADKLLALLNR
jgi:glycine/D-amino acid oxidase-like deaminating enzyme